MGRSKAKLLLLSAIGGLFAGLAATVFLYALNFATQARDAHRWIIWMLPLAGLAIGWSYHYLGTAAARGTRLIVDEIHDPKNITPARMTPLILATTVITHLFGGSAGREGTAVQMGGSLADQLGRYFHITRQERRVLLVAGAGAGFAAAIGAPWAACVFGMELIYIGRVKVFGFFECVIASLIGYYTTVWLHAPHSHYPQFEIPSYEWRAVFSMVVAGVIFGFCARSFIAITHAIERLMLRVVSYPPLRPALGGLLLVILYKVEGSYDYAGLGIPYIQDALLHPSGFRLPLLKELFSALTLGSGFKGGEFVPLVFIGTTLGSALGYFLPVSFQVLGGVGFAAVFAGASNTPLACTLMAMEIFGTRIGPYALIACLVSNFFSGDEGIYATRAIPYGEVPPALSSTD